jgi:hypothetical protein
MNFSDLYPSRYLKASDLEGPVTVVIESLDQEEVGKDRDVKPVMRFRGVGKPLILNRTNGAAIAKLYGQATAAWLGKPVQLYTATVEVGGEQHDAIRVRAPAAAAKAKSQAPLRMPEPPLGESGDPGPVFEDRGDQIPF